MSKRLFFVSLISIAGLDQKSCETTYGAFCRWEQSPFGVSGGTCVNK